MQGRTAPKKPTNLKLDLALLAEARAVGVNLSRAAEAGLRQAVTTARAHAWQQENAAALASSNAWAEAHGLLLDPYRRF